MGPKVIGSKFVKAKFCGLERGIGGENFLKTDTLINQSLTVAEALNEADENARRYQVVRIVEAWNIFQDGLENSNIASTPLSADEDIEMKDNTNIDGQTFTDIIDYLIECRRELSLESLHFRIGEHVLFAHILKDCLQISSEEFRAFLTRCTKEKKYFR